MNHPTDTYPATHPTQGSGLCRSGCPSGLQGDPAFGGRATRQTRCATHDSVQLKLLDTLVEKIIEALAENSCKVKVGDALRAIQLREKVAKKSEAEQIFWQMIEEIKAEGPPGSHPEFTPLQRQIHSAILPLRDCVKNAILPVKTITEAFNGSRSEQARLTTRRMGKLLAGMGFTMVKASNGSSAIIWDDDLLPPTPPPGQQNPASAAGLNALPYDSPEGASSHIEAGIHVASDPVAQPSPPSARSTDTTVSTPLDDPPGGVNRTAHPQGGGATGQSAEGAGGGMGSSSPLGERTEVRGNLPCRSGCPSGLQGDAVEDGGATRQSDEGVKCKDSCKIRRRDIRFFVCE